MAQQQARPHGDRPDEQDEPYGLGEFPAPRRPRPADEDADEAPDEAERIDESPDSAGAAAAASGRRDAGVNAGADPGVRNRS